MNRFYDIVERAYVFSKNVVLFVTKVEIKRLYYPIIDQLLRSATSIGANIIEGKSGNSRKNLINYFSIALRSANETKYWLRLIMDTIKCDSVLINEGELNYLMKE